MRLIPAHAGKTVGLRLWRAVKPAHPRSRGENHLRHLPSQICCGSSPLTRGKLEFNGLDPFAVGLIPAHAGKTVSVAPHSISSTAHPRSRGENASHALATSSASGSSPLTRGKRPGTRGSWAALRLIPAHAGKTALSGASMRSPRAHPRSPGENLPAPSVDVAVSGSSPLTRGKQIIHPQDRRERRLIPAHAGKTPV